MGVIDWNLHSEKKIHSRLTAIQSPNKNFLKILQLAYTLTGQEQKAKEVGERVARRGKIAQEINLDVNIFKQAKKRSLLEEILKSTESFSEQGKPIIVIPAQMAPGNLSLQNAKQFLENGQYVSAAEENKEHSFQRNVIEVKHKIGD
eukprot:CAMPEP_0202965692 /NCGR_PEP_ID=MMETSP1396-20130829/9650_1 /ASSEMBLY_ACC=CAM_ASM_000872 /TAXON_ID= /ORGANISM="Pseudokeronopsis sp., Strain Brazil" /LENGTH=146 /DNA_ID=CAMNT_0049688563 /DNA_START=424 /DNA_END=864 /DNA_ORIENTATION=-